jgi:glycerophosphoryl diester phosphodiesterase
MPRPVFDRPIAHRGLHDRSSGVIENSRTAFQRAIAAGYAVECDLQLSSDGVPMVFHDSNLDRLVGRPGRVVDTPAAQLAEMDLLGSADGDRPQSFADLLSQVRGQVLLQVELKRQEGHATPMLAKQVATLALGYPGPIVIESFDPALLILVARFGFLGPRGIITERYDDLSDPDVVRLSRARRGFLRGLWHWPWSRFDFISASKDALDLPAIRLFRMLGKPVTTWTIRSQREAAATAGHADQIVFEGFDPDRA